MMMIKFSIFVSDLRAHPRSLGVRNEESENHGARQEDGADPAVDAPSAALRRRRGSKSPLAGSRVVLCHLEVLSSQIIDVVVSGFSRDKILVKSQS